LVELVLILKLTVWPRLTLMSVAKPSMFELPAPTMSHSLGGLPGFSFSSVIGLITVAAAVAWVCSCRAVAADGTG